MLVFFVKYEDPSQWRDEGESGDAFIRAFTETAEAQARDTFATFFSKAKRDRYPSVCAENDEAPEESHVPRYPTLPAPPAPHTLWK
jgi:hypothetical protein